MNKKEFIFPMNYKSREKFLGFIDYKIIITIVAFSSLTFFILKNLEINLTIKVTVFILVVGFFSIFIIVGINGENMLDFLWFMGKFLIKEKVYVYRKIENKEVIKYEEICENILPNKKYL